MIVYDAQLVVPADADPAVVTALRSALKSFNATIVRDEATAPPDSYGLTISARHLPDPPDV